MTSLPLFQSVAQALTPNALNRTEAYRVPGLDAYAGDALSADTFASFNLPYFGDPHPNNPNILVTNIGLAPSGPGASVVSLTYGPPNQASGSQDITDLPLTDVSFDVRTTSLVADVPVITGAPVRTDTQEVDSGGQPTGNTIGVARPGFESNIKRVAFDGAEIRLTVTGTASQIGVSNEFGSIGAVPAIVGLARTLHNIGGVALLFRGLDVRWTRSESGQRVYTLDYGWSYEAGIRNTPASLPEGWTADPGVGPASGQEPILNAIGEFEPDANGDQLYGVATPDVPPPPSSRGFGHIGGATTRYTQPPYASVETYGRPGGDFGVPKFIARPQYDQVDAANNWQNFPGVG